MDFFIHKPNIPINNLSPTRFQNPLGFGFLSLTQANYGFFMQNSS